MTAHATIEMTTETNEDGREMPCVYATCSSSDETVGPVWGHGDASVKRALAMLSAECSCGTRWHSEDEE